MQDPQTCNERQADERADTGGYYAERAMRKEEVEDVVASHLMTQR